MIHIPGKMFFVRGGLPALTRCNSYAALTAGSWSLYKTLQAVNEATDV